MPQSIDALEVVSTIKKLMDEYLPAHKNVIHYLQGIEMKHL